jgi:hypothetical protein
MSSYYTILIQLLACHAYAEKTVGFVQQDNSRDTTSLVISCLVTLAICVYSAIHLNIPSRKEPYYWTLWREFRWCLVGLFAPELALYTAWRQRASAKQLCDGIKDLPADSVYEKSAPKQDYLEKVGKL